MPEIIRIAPQPGPQSRFLSSIASIAIYGGAAGGGKTFALLLDPLYHFNNPKFIGVILRRNTTQIRNPGGLWQESMGLYSQIGGYSREAFLEWKFPSGSRMKFAHLEYERTKFDWQGSQFSYLGFDELTHFSSTQFFYLMSRLRSMSGVSGYIRASCNPDADSWVKTLIQWWLDKDGDPIKERSGILRWFIRQNDEIIWADTKQELTEKYGSEQQPKSLTFIPSSIYDNKLLLDKDPAYLSNLMALSRVDRLRLLGGNWNVRAAAGMLFQKEWFELLDAVPTGHIRQVRAWDRAATKPNETNKDPDWTVGLKLNKYPNGWYVVTDVRRIRDTPLQVERFIKNTALQDGYECPVILEQDPGSSGVADVQNLARLLAGFNVRIRKVDKDKITRAKPVSAQCEAGNVKVVKGLWNDEFFSEIENFGEDSTGHDDQVDTLSRSFLELSDDSQFSLFDVM